MSVEPARGACARSLDCKCYHRGGVVGTRSAGGFHAGSQSAGLWMVECGLLLPSERNNSLALFLAISVSLFPERERERESLVVHDSPIITVELRSRPRQYLSESIALD